MKYIFKKVEIYFRRKIITFLSCFIKRGNDLPKNINFDRCKFLFIRQDRIGDVLISTPLFEVLKKYYPNCIIDVLLSENNHFVLDNNPHIRKKWIYKKKFVKIYHLIRDIRLEKYDFAIDLMDNPSATSTLLMMLISAKWNVGLEKENSFVYDLKVPLLSRKETHIVDRIAQLLIPFGINPESEKLCIKYYTGKESDKYAESFLVNNKLEGKPIIGINISAGSDTRFWGVDNYKKFIQYINSNYPQFKVLLLYKSADKERAERIYESCSYITLMPPDLTFDQYSALIKTLTLLITPDTSAVHLAAAFNIPVVVLYVQSNKELRIWEPYGTDYEALIADIDDLTVISLTDVQNALSRIIRRHQTVNN